MSSIIDFNIKKGKIYFGTIDNMSQIDANIYLYCTTYSSNIPDGTLLVEELAPSVELLLQKKAWLDKGTFNEKFETFRELYINEMYERPDYQKAMKRIMELAEEGKTIVLFDDCNLGKYCHLNILKEEMKRKGYRVYEIGISKQINNPLSMIRW